MHPAIRTVARFGLSMLPSELSLSVRHRERHGRWPDLHSPKTFNEKVLYFKLHERNPLLPTLIDKILVKDWVRKKLGDSWVTPTLWWGKELPDRSQRNWPMPYVIKANHGSKWNVFVFDRVSDWAGIEADCKTWVTSRWHPELHEWAYGLIDPNLLVEPYNGTRANPAPDCKFYVFGGRVELVHVDIDRFTGHTRKYFDRNWVPQNIQSEFPNDERDLPAPPHLKEMIEGAEELGKGFAFARVDLYDCGRPLFGEMTFYHGSGLCTFNPVSTDLTLGALWPAGDESGRAPRI